VTGARLPVVASPLVAAPVVVLDIDGVLADVRHRLHYLATRPKNWERFFAAAKNDPVLEVGAEFAKQAATTHEIIYLTGRPDRLRAATQAWLDQQQLPPGRLVMRPEGDRRPSAVVKLHELRKLRRESAVELLVDDDPSVIEAARAAGFTAQLADWMPRPADPDQPLFGRDLLHDAQQREGRT
jgi:phosphoglycolate phosphatase-like HAD superfamily hydrolase